LFAVTALPALAQDAGTPRLNVSIATFDPGVPIDPSLHRDLEIFPRIRKIEAMFLPFVLRQALVATGEWGAVRVVPEPEPAAELLVTGRVGRSDGETLELFVRAVDASGRTWFDRTFAGTVTDNYAQRGEEISGAPSYQPLYDEIAAELRAARDRLDAKTLGNISEISLLRYGSELAPSAFGDYLGENGDGTVTLRRLPAVNDPMLERIRLIRETEYVITDAIDAKFREFHAEIGKVYDVWRRYRRHIVSYQQREASRAIENRNDAPRGSYEAYQEAYDNYKRDRLAGQEQDRLAVAFNNEVGPRVLAMEARIDELDDWVDTKYAEWHRLLEELFEAETSMEQ
jgi:hypothetical protein